MATFLTAAGATTPFLPFALAIVFLAGVSTGIVTAAKQTAIFAVAGLIAGVLLGIPAGMATAGLPNAIPTALHLLVAAAALLALAAAAWRIFRQNDSIELQSEWGTLGQGLGGWRITPAAALLLLGTVLAALAIGMPITSQGDGKTSQAGQTDTHKT